MKGASRFEETGFPSLSRSSKHELVYENVEYLYDVYGATNYVTTSMPVNPGLPESFPILSGLSLTFETYKFEHLEFFYKPMITELSTASPTLGSVGMTFSYDPGDNFTSINTLNDTFPSKLSFLNYEGSISDKSSFPMRLNVNCNHSLLYVRNGELTTNMDIRMSDLGTFVWYVSGQLGTGMIGEIYVKYRVRFLKSHPNYSLANSNKYAHYQCSGRIATDQWFGSVQTAMPGTTMPLTFQYFTDSGGLQRSNLLFPPSATVNNYLFIFRMVGTSTAWNLNIVVAGGLNLLDNSTGSHSSATPPAASTTMDYYGFYRTSSSVGQSGNLANQFRIQLSTLGSTCITNPTSCDIFVMQIPSNDLT